MSDDSKEFVLEIEEEYYLLIEEYSDYSNKSEQYVVNQLLNYSLRKYAEKYIELKKGYLEMGTINLEISKAFRNSESEAFNRIKDGSDILNERGKD